MALGNAVPGPVTYDLAQWKPFGLVSFPRPPRPKELVRPEIGD